MWPPHRNSSPLNGTANPCRDGAVHTIGLPSMWRNIPATRSHTHQLAVHNHNEMVPLSKKKKKTDRRKDELTLPGDSVCLNIVFIQFTTEEMACRCKGLGGVKMCSLFFTARLSCMTAVGHMLLNCRAMSAHGCSVKG